MKHSLWRLISSFYILLISGLMVIISAYAWMVISKAPGVNGPNIGISMPNVPKVFYDTVTSDQLDQMSLEDINRKTLGDGTVEYSIESAEDFVVVMRAIDEGKISGKVALCLRTHISLETTSVWNADNWKGVYLNSLLTNADVSAGDSMEYNVNESEAEENPVEKVTIYADTAELKQPTAYIRGLTDALFRGGDSAIASIELRDITIISSNIYSEDPTGGGAFVSFADNMPSVVIRNCHLIDSTIRSATRSGSYARVGGIVGYARAWMVRIEDCSVNGCHLEGSSVGGIVGHSSANEGKRTVIVNGKVFDTELYSLDDGDWRVGEIVGTINAGMTVIADPECAQNKLSQPDVSGAEGSNPVYGRYVPGDKSAFNFVNTELSSVDVFHGFIQEAADCFDADTSWQTWKIHGKVRMENEIRFQGNHVDIVGQDNAVIELTGTSTIADTAVGTSDSPAGFNFGQLGANTATFQENSSVKFTGITFNNTKVSSKNTKDPSHHYMYANARNAIYENCVFDRGVLVYGSASFKNCRITENSENTIPYACLLIAGDSEDMTCSISDSVFYAGAASQGCVLMEGNRNIFLLSNSEFYNDTSLPAVYIKGAMDIITDGNNLFTSEAGGILTEQKDSCTFNDSEFYCPTKDDYQNADILTKVQMDRTEHGNNSKKTSDPDAGIVYDGVAQEEIPDEVPQDPGIEDPKTYTVDSAEKFIAVMKMLNQKDPVSGASLLEGNYRIILTKHIDLSGYAWESVSINDANSKLGTLTIEADTEALGAETAFINGLSAPLFDRLESASSTKIEIVLKNITAIRADMNLQTLEHEYTTYANAGVFVSTAILQKGTLKFENCHVLNSSIQSAPSTDGEYSRTGGIIGYANSAHVWLTDCSVRTAVLTGASAGGIVGHASASQGRETYIVDCFVENTEITCLEEGSWRVGEIVGTANQGGVTIVNPMVLDNKLAQTVATDGISKAPGSSNNGDPNYFLYGRQSAVSRGGLIFVDTKTDPQLHTAVVYSGFDSHATQFLTTEKQVWLVYGSARVSEEMRFTGNDITVKPYGDERATILLNSTVKTNGFGMGQDKTPSGFNFGAYTKKTSFKPNSKIYFENLKIQNKKSCTINTTTDRVYTYAFAEHVFYKNCAFEDGVVVYGNAEFDTCTFETFRANDLCLILENNSYDCTIKNCTFTAKEDAEYCVVSNGTNALTVQNSQFMNSTEYPAIVLNGETTVTTDKQNTFYSEEGGILAVNAGCTFNGEACLTRTQYQNADLLTKSQYDQTENGNNGGVKSPDHLIGYKTPAADAIIPELSEIQTDANGAYLINTAEEFIAVMSMLNEAEDLSEDVTVILQAHLNFEGYDFTSIDIDDTAKTMRTITIKADTEALGTSTVFIKGLNKPLFNNAVSTSRNAGIVLEDITMIGSVMELDTNVYENAGAFISAAKFQYGSVIIRNCHSLNNTINSTPDDAENAYSRTGGIIGYTNASSFLIEDCSVRGCTLTGASAGGIVGHASASQSRETYIVNCFVEGTKLSCIETGADWRVGEFVGTANQGGVVIVNPMISESSPNTLTQEGVTDSHNADDPNRTLYGRFKPSASGNGSLIFIHNKGEIHEAVVYGAFNQNAAQFMTSEEQTWLIYTDSAYLKNEMRFAGSTITVKPYQTDKNVSVILNSRSTSVYWKGGSTSPSGFNFGNADEYKTAFKPDSGIIFENLTFKNQKTYYNNNSSNQVYDERTYTYAFAENVSYTGCTFEGGVAVYGNAQFQSCAFTTREDDGNPYTNEAFCLILSKDNVTLSGDYTCVLTDCMIDASSIEANERAYEIRQS